MDLSCLKRNDEHRWLREPEGKMRVPAILHGDDVSLRATDDRVLEQLSWLAMLPGIVAAAHALPGAYPGHGTPVGSVAAFDPAEGGVICPAAAGFDFARGTRLLTTGLVAADLTDRIRLQLTEELYGSLPTTLESSGLVYLSDERLDALLEGGARWVVEQGCGTADDLQRIEDQGCVGGADPARVPERGRQRQADPTANLGAGNHYLEVLRVAETQDERGAADLGLKQDELVVTIRAGARGLGHEVASHFLATMSAAADQHEISLPDRELACAPIHSELGAAYLGAMRAAANCALAYRQVITQQLRELFVGLLPKAELNTVCDLSHNSCREEEHRVDGQVLSLLVHRKGASRLLPAGHSALPIGLTEVGQPVLFNGIMGSASYVLTATESTSEIAFGSTGHGSCRALSRHDALQRFSGPAIVKRMEKRGIALRGPSRRGLAEEAPGAYRDLGRLVTATEKAGLARLVARLEPVICVKARPITDPQS